MKHSLSADALGSDDGEAQTTLAPRKLVLSVRIIAVTDSPDIKQVSKIAVNEADRVQGTRRPPTP